MVARPAADAPSVAVQVEGPNAASLEDAVVIRSLSYAYAGHRPILSDISLALPRGSRCLLVGANGAGGCAQAPQPPCCSLHY
jgi:CCR4-NOT complex subunit CAF16